MLGEIPANLAEVMLAATSITDERRFYFEGNGILPDGLFNGPAALLAFHRRANATHRTGQLKALPETLPGRP